MTRFYGVRGALAHRRSYSSSAATCTLCGAVLFWTRTRNGNPIALDDAPSDLGTLALEGGFAVPLADLSEAARAAVFRYRAHADSCPGVGGATEGRA